MARTAKKLSFEDVGALVAILGAVGSQEKKAPLTKPQVAELTGLTGTQVTAFYKKLLKLELVSQIEAPKGMPLKGVYVKITTKGKAYIKAFDLLFS